MSSQNKNQKTSLSFDPWIVLGLVLVIGLFTGLHFLSSSNEYEQIKRHSVFLGDQFEKYTSQVLKSEFSGTAQCIDQQIEQAFEPVYQGIGKVADQHYTIKGQYLELVSDYFINQVNQLMLLGLDQRLESANEAVQSAYYQELEAKTRMFIKENNPEFFSARRKLFNELFEFVLDDAWQRFKTPEIIATRAASAGIGLAAGVHTYRKVAAAWTKLAARRSMGTGSAMALGAAAGSSLGPAGILVGAGIGGAAAWLASDVLIVKLDEYLNRQEFEAELRAIVDAHKLEIKSALKIQVQEANMNIAQYTPRELITGIQQEK